MIFSVLAILGCDLAHRSQPSTNTLHAHCSSCLKACDRLCDTHMGHTTPAEGGRKKTGETAIEVG